MIHTNESGEGVYHVCVTRTELKTKAAAACAPGRLCSFMNVFTDEAGAVAVIAALLLVAMTAIAAFVIDIGSLYQERRELQTAADAGALAGVQELPDNPARAVEVARAFVTANTGRHVTSSVKLTATNVANDTIEVRVSDSASPLYFARVLGLRTARVSATARAIVASPGAYSSGVMPFGLMSSTEAAQNLQLFGYAFGQEITLKEAAGDGSQGNFYFIDLDGRQAGGQNDIGRWLGTGGSSGFTVSIGQLLPPQTGNPSVVGSSRPGDGLEDWITCLHRFEEVCVDFDPETGRVTIENPGNETPRCHRLIVVPVLVNPAYPENNPLRYNWIQVTGSSQDLLVVGFAYVFVTGWGVEGRGTGRYSYLKGRFVRPLEENELELGAPSSFAPIIFKLIE